ncbi:Piso0_005184 [Millerozyma farinosa CBS 7064]|uniref:Piso0_005184 protein n=1 Tax=Pichia sorbitophila (strain ATCC MYA-4447 / BCRC 22081 / CBS 7064 / NBRC 10061 / NRRL Y-12695) TaxID=559304 RepID=G8Y4F8_PICSO|nr:Piso0_005184 [Millerozyma farinosa CBS 7064]
MKRRQHWESQWTWLGAWTWVLWTSVVLSLVSSTEGSLYMGFPMDEQLPNVARVNEQYSFTLAETTYKSNGGSVEYSASNLPEWLSFDGGSRTFSGIPSSDDVKEFEITLTGNDTSDGSTLSNNYSMIVSSSSGLHLSSNDVMFTEIAKEGNTNGVDALVVKPGEKINIKFEKSVFEKYENATRSIVAYYGRSQDRSSLPNWLNFNSDDLSFTGTVPYVTSDVAPSVQYGFSFIGSDYEGYAGAEGIFKLEIGAHQLSTSVSRTLKINGTFDHPFEEVVPIFSDVFLDNKTISRDNISQVYAENNPNYVSFHDSNFTLTGVFPDSSTHDNFSVIIEDVFGNSVSIPYSFEAIGSVFTVDSLNDVNATKGKFFQYQLLNSSFTDNQTKISVDYDASWLSYSKNNRTFTGDVPKNFDKLVVNVTASSDYDEESKTFSIKGVDPKSSSSSSSSGKPSSTTQSSVKSSSSASNSAAAGTGHKKSSNVALAKGLGIGLGIGIPVLLAFLAALFFFCCYRKKRNEKKSEPDLEKDDGYTEITGPGIGKTYDMDDHSETAKPLNALNLIKLEKKEEMSGDVKSTSSSVTHVDSDESKSSYFDATEKPAKSWRANDKSDANMYDDESVITKGATQKDNFYRSSDGSMSTVNTEQLFSVRLVEDQSNRNSNMSSFNSNRMLASSSNNAIFKRESSGNIQRLDSDGNIVEATQPNQNILRSSSTDLDVLEEENTKDHDDSSNTITKTGPNQYRDESTESSMNLLTKLSYPSFTGITNDKANNLNEGYSDQFKAMKDPNGRITWSDASQPATPVVEDYESEIMNGKSSAPLQSSGLFAFSKSSSEDLTYNQDGRSSSSPVQKAKLVDFTRKSSMKEAARHSFLDFEGETAQIHDDDDDSI